MTEPAVTATSRRGVPDLPASLTTRGFTLREEVEDDLPFLLTLFASTREAELEPLGWPPEQKARFLGQQFEAQRRSYRLQIQDGLWLILEQGGRGAGRLYLEDRGATLHVLDISLSPSRRGRGVGTAILLGVIGTAALDNKGVSVFVEKSNPAQRLYRRLGFVEVADTGAYLEMERPFGVPALRPQAEDAIS